MRVLGIGDSHDSGITLFENGKVIYAANQERLDRIKLSSGWPVDCLIYLRDVLHINLSDIDLIAIAGEYGPFIESHTTLNILQLEQNVSKERSFMSKTQNVLSSVYQSKLGTLGMKIALRTLFRDRKSKIIKILKENGFNGEIIFLDHHLCHAASAVFSCTYEVFHKKSLVITADGAGDGLSGTVYIAENGKLKKIHEINQFNSLALYYSYVTELCGFTPMKHEGKITGLAAYGKPIYYDLFRNMIVYKNGSFYNKSGVQHQAALNFIKEKTWDFDKANLSSSIQIYLENVFSKFVEYWIRKTGVGDVLLAGGIFANVKLNQRINELPSVKSVFVHQNMGDGGISFGAAALESFEKSGIYVEPEKHVCFGQGYSNEEIEKALKSYVLKYRKYNNVEKEIALLLSSGKVIARFNGKMEYGPRALGNRTILYQTTDPKVNDWLNKRLKRTEFMPFAPVTLIEEAEKCYKRILGGEYAARFMTITFDCTDFMKKKSPAVVHVDGTARPQLIDKNTNPSYRKILEEYYDITGIPSLINTSFNMHEEPIVCSPDDAIRSFLQGNLDYLAIGDFLVKSNFGKK